MVEKRRWKWRYDHGRTAHLYNERDEALCGSPCLVAAVFCGVAVVMEHLCIDCITIANRDTVATRE